MSEYYLNKIAYYQQLIADSQAEMEEQAVYYEDILAKYESALSEAEDILIDLDSALSTPSTINQHSDLALPIHLRNIQSGRDIRGLAQTSEVAQKNMPIENVSTLHSARYMRPLDAVLEENPGRYMTARSLEHNALDLARTQGRLQGISRIEGVHSPVLRRIRAWIAESADIHPGASAPPSGKSPSGPVGIGRQYKPFLRQGKIWQI